MTSESGVPELPSGVRLPLYAVGNSFGDMYHLGATLWTSDQAKFIAELINAVYTPGTGLRDRLKTTEHRLDVCIKRQQCSDLANQELRDRLAAAEEELARLKEAQQ